MEQVICVDAKLKFYYPNCDPLVKGQIYTTVRSYTATDGTPGLVVQEASTGVLHPNGEEMGYHQDHFRPIKDENIEIFREMDRKIFKKIDA